MRDCQGRIGLNVRYFNLLLNIVIFTRCKKLILHHLHVSLTLKRQLAFSGMLAVALDDFTISIFDLEMKRIVRHFSGQRGQINDMVRDFFRKVMEFLHSSRLYMRFMSNHFLRPCPPSPPCMSFFFGCCADFQP